MSEEDQSSLARLRSDSIMREPTAEINLSAEDDTQNFFHPLQQAEPAMRQAAITSIIEFLMAPEHEKLLRAHIARIVRLATESPFEDITTSFHQLLITIEKERPSIHIPAPLKEASTFVPVPSLTTYNKVLEDLFLQTGRVSHMNQVLALQPDYFERHYLTFDHIMRESGPLPLLWRNYIAILAASRFNCTYLVSIQEQQFLLNGGDRLWLQDPKHSSQKMQNLMEVIALIAHQPWLLTKEHFEPLVKGVDSWSIGELVHALLIICTFVSLAGFVYACGIIPEVDLKESKASQQDNPVAEDSTEEALHDETSLMDLLKLATPDESTDPEQEFALAGSNSGVTPKLDKKPTDLSKYKSSVPMEHVDFEVKSRNYSIFRVQEYGWKEHGYELIRRFYPDMADMLDDEFLFSYNMTDNKLKDKEGVDTKPLRRAIWYYVQRVKGMCHDDYNYQEVNKLLNRNVKSFVKKVVCYPDTITRTDFANLGTELGPQEKCHIAILALESHKQATMLYGLHHIFKMSTKH